MKGLFAVTFIFFLIGCGRAPSPASVSAIKRELPTPIEFDDRSLKIKRNYQTGTEIFNFFLWPNVSRQEQVEISAKVAQLGLQIEDVYKRIDLLSFDKSKIEREILVLDQFRDEKLSVIFKDYKCWVETEDAEVCGEDNIGHAKLPAECFDLVFEPWNSEELAKECEEKSEKIIENYEEKREEIEERIAPFEEKIDEELEIVTDRADQITSALENGEENSEKWQNWFQTKVSNFEFFEDGSVPKISLSIQFNNMAASERNRYLRYKSDDEKNEDKARGITGVKRYLDGPVPTLEFIIHEKRALRSSKEELTGTYYKVVLRENELDYGLELLGEIEKYDSHGRAVGKGMMKVYLKPKY
jgi:DNA-binding transcriptional MerR regulator